MINDIIILDDVVTPSYQQYLENMFMGEQMTNWLLLNDISYDVVQSSFGVKTVRPGLVHPLKVDGQVKSHLYNLTLPLIFNSIDTIGFKYHDIFQGRSFLQFPNPESLVNNPHIDLTFPHLVCLYYVNDSDGDTILYEQTSNDFGEVDVKSKEFTVKKRVSPKRGRVLLFDGKYYHSSSSPTSNQRCIINFNLI
jgi:hypothetical protein